VLDPIQLVYCGYIGGSQYEFTGGTAGIAVDASGYAYVVGTANSTELEGFPVVAGSWDTTWAGGVHDVFVAKVKAEISEEGPGVLLRLTPIPELGKAGGRLVDSALLGKAKVSGAGYENPDGSPLVIDADYLGSKRNPGRPAPGPLENPGQGAPIKIW
jgi:hypothetical protein